MRCGRDLALPILILLEGGAFPVGSFWSVQVNPRIQVEHTITEEAGRFFCPAAHLGLPFAGHGCGHCEDPAGHRRQCCCGCLSAGQGLFLQKGGDRNPANSRFHALVKCAFRILRGRSPHLLVSHGCLLGRLGLGLSGGAKLEELNLPGGREAEEFQRKRGRHASVVRTKTMLYHKKDCYIPTGFLALVIV